MKQQSPEISSGYSRRLIITILFTISYQAYFDMGLWQIVVCWRISDIVMELQSLLHALIIKQKSYIKVNPYKYVKFNEILCYYQQTSDL